MSEIELRDFWEKKVWLTCCFPVLTRTFSNIFPLNLYILSIQNAQDFVSSLIFRILVDFNVRGIMGIYSQNCAIFTQKSQYTARNKIRQNSKYHVRNKWLGILERQNISLQRKNIGEYTQQNWKPSHSPNQFFWILPMKKDLVKLEVSNIK